MLGGAGEVGGGEGGGVIRQVCCVEAGEEAEAEIKAADENPRGEAHGAGGDAELGDEPEGVWSEVRAQAAGECVEIGLSKAVQKEVSDDEVIGAAGGKVAGVGDMGA